MTIRFLGYGGGGAWEDSAFQNPDRPCLRSFSGRSSTSASFARRALLFLPLCCLVDAGEAMLIRAVLLANGPPTGAASAWLKRGVKRGLKIWLLAVAVGGWVGGLFFTVLFSFLKASR